MDSRDDTLIIPLSLRTIASKTKDGFVHMKTTTQPFSPKLVTRVLVVLVVVLAIVAGYYYNRYYIWRENHIKVLDKFDVNTTKELLEKEVEVK